MKKFISLILCITIAASTMLLASCGTKDDNSIDTPDPEAINAEDLFGDAEMTSEETDTEAIN